jgi:orotidine-5'-phosphate decarboxylase
MFSATDHVKDRLIVALDFSGRDRALVLVERLSGLVGMFKVGMQLFTAEGPRFVRELIEAGERVFLDLKFHDIPNTVAGAAQASAALGVSMFNVHALGGSEMMRAAIFATSRCSGERPKVLAVTLLTSIDEPALSELGIAPDANSEVVRLAQLARDSGLDGVIASPREVKLIRERVAPERFIILTPGVRPKWAESGDQRRIATPADAMRDGADFIVIGRPITASSDPRSAAERVLEEIDKALR